MRETSPSVLLMAKPSGLSASAVGRSSPLRLYNASSRQGRWVTCLQVIHGPRSDGTARRGRRHRVARRPKGGTLTQLFAGVLS